MKGVPATEGRRERRKLQAEETRREESSTVGFSSRAERWLGHAQSDIDAEKIFFPGWEDERWAQLSRDVVVLEIRTGDLFVLDCWR
jgi:hypothetical protein